MSWLLIAIAAQFIIGSSAVFDKLLLKKRAVEPWSYTFWFGLLGAFAALLLPFGFETTPWPVTALAILGGIFFVASSFFYFAAIEKIEASEALPLLGALSPIFTLILSSLFLGLGLSGLDAIGFAFLITSGFILFVIERKEIGLNHLGMIALSALFLAASHVASKAVFSQTSFITGFFWVKIGGVLFALSFLAWPAVRSKIVASEHAPRKNKIFYFANRAYAGAGSILISLAIFLSSPSLVDAMQNIRYIVIFLLGWLVLREKFKGKILIGKIAATLLITGGLFWLGLAEYARSLPAVPAKRPIQWGVTFSPKFSRDLGLDWQENFRTVLNDLRPQKLRLVAYWSDIEKERGKFDFSDLDWQLYEASQSGKSDIILVVGLKTPRWPECHAPEWTKAFGREEREEALRIYIAKVIERYRDHPMLTIWQVENEPYLAFGQCAARGNNFLDKEIELAKSLDPRHPVLTTDGGEFGLWAPAAKRGDIFGTTMYRKVYPRFIGPLFGVIEYPLSPNYFRIKEKITRIFTGSPGQRFIVIELQGEPWSPTPLRDASYQWQIESFSPEYLEQTIEYAKAAGFDEYYLWGSEWWYWLGKKHNNWDYWDIARQLLK